jgi:hypothetical protein
LWLLLALPLLVLLTASAAAPEEKKWLCLVYSSLVSCARALGADKAFARRHIHRCCSLLLSLAMLVATRDGCRGNLQPSQNETIMLYGRVEGSLYGRRRAAQPAGGVAKMPPGLPDRPAAQRARQASWPLPAAAVVQPLSRETW